MAGCYPGTGCPDVQHVGNTAVPGLAAKLILDTAVAVASPTGIEPCRVARGNTGYIDRGDQGDDGGWLFVRAWEPGVRTVHLHLVTIDDPQWRRYLDFLDQLLTNPALQSAYTHLKIALRTRYPTDRLAYTAGKHDFIRRVLDYEASGS